MRPEPTRARLVRLTALATLSVPVVAGLLLLTPDGAQAAASPFTITCPQRDGSAGGTPVTGHRTSCGTYADSAQAVVTASCQPLACSLGPTFVVTSPTGSRLSSDSLGVTHPDATYAVLAGSADGMYTATLSGGGADVSATFVLQASPVSTAPDPTATSSSPGGAAAPPTTRAPTTGAPTTGAAGGSTPSAGSSGAPSTVGATPSHRSGYAPGAAAAGGGHGAAVGFPSLPPPAGIAQLPPLPQFPGSPKTEPGVPGPYGTTLPYDGSVTVAEKTASEPTLLRHVADTVDDKQVAESVAAALLALVLATHLRGFTRRPSGDADL